VSCHWTIPQQLVHTKKTIKLIMLYFYFSQDKLFSVSAEHMEKKYLGERSELSMNQIAFDF